MRGPSRTAARLRIARLDLDLRGIAPATGEAAARALGPALARTLGQRQPRFEPADRIDAGRIHSPGSPDPHGLAVQIAQRIAHALEREEER
jgi:hypothetical protein